MSTAEIKVAGTDLDVMADLEAVMKHLADGTPVDPELGSRVRERSRRLTEETRIRLGQVDVDALLHSVRDE